MRHKLRRVTGKPSHQDFGLADLNWDESRGLSRIHISFESCALVAESIAVREENETLFCRDITSSTLFNIVARGTCKHSLIGYNETRARSIITGSLFEL
jgi:hypothetical protein